MVDLTVIIPSSEKITKSIGGLGKLTGLSIRDPDTNVEKIQRFTGVPYAQPPVGPLRWRRPQPFPTGHDYSGDYSDFKSICPQPVYESIRIDKPVFEYSEDCLRLNIWIPAGQPPVGGWPVLYFIHGGWLQVGNPSQTRTQDPQDLLAPDSPINPYIVVAPVYRLNLFGFLYGDALADEDPKNSNFGFWDQRAGLEWIHQHIKGFGGNPDNITVGGLSAGSYSAIFQLAYELYHPEAKQIIKKVFLESNGLAVQPKSGQETQLQFDQVLQAFGINPDSENSAEKLRLLRAIPAEEFVKKIPHLALHTFRAVTDGDFVSPHLFRDIYTGEFGKKFAASGRQMTVGEVNNELVLYSKTNPPKTWDDLKTQIVNYYPETVADALLYLYRNVPALGDTEQEQIAYKFGNIVSDMQVYSSSRLLIDGLIKGGVPLSRINRYRISYRPHVVDEYIPPENLVQHAADSFVWWYPAVIGILPEEEPLLKAWLEPFGEWINANIDDPSESAAINKRWGTSSPQEFRHFRADGLVEILPDDRWQWYHKVRETVGKVELQNE